MTYQLRQSLALCCSYFVLTLLAGRSSDGAFLAPVSPWRQSSVPKPLTFTRRLEKREPSYDEKTETKNRPSEGPLDFLLNPYQSKIPKELEKEIYEAEGKTQAAKDRSQRIALYAVAAFAGVLLAFFNVFISELRNGPMPEGATEPFELASTGFGWVESNFLFRFLFMNKIGGGLCLLGGAGAGLLAEAEFDTRRINSEKIWEEMQRRRELKEKSKKTKKGKKKRRPGKEAKRLSALSEVTSTGTANQENSPTPVADEKPVVEEQQSTEVKEEAADKEEEGKGGLLEGIKGFYEKADQMAATQALLVNKKLEDEGILEKITDETGLKVIGKDAAAKLNDDEEETTTPSTTTGPSSDTK